MPLVVGNRSGYHAYNKTKKGEDKTMKRLIALAVSALAFIGLTRADETISSDVTLSADADWRSKGVVTINSGVTVNLNGYDLTLAGLTGEGTVKSVAVDLTTTDASRASTTTKLLGGTAANAFNNNFARSGTDNTKRIIVEKKNLPLVIDYDFGEGAEKAVTSYKLYCGPISGYTNRCPKDWTFEGSNDNENWTVIDTRASEPAWAGAGSGEARLKSFENTKAYRYYRFKITTTQGGDYLEIVQLEYFGGSSASELTLDIPENTTVANSGVLIEGAISVVKKGAGTFVAGKAKQTYTEGTHVVAGTLQSGVTTYQEYPFGTGAITVDSGATLDANGNSTLYLNNITLAGGTIANTSGALTTDDRQLGVVTLTADSSLVATTSYGFLNKDYNETTLNLNGYTLNVSIGAGAVFRLVNTTIDAGTINVTQNDGIFCFYLWPTRAKNTTFNLTGDVRAYTVCELGNLSLDANAFTLHHDYDTSYLKVYGTLTPLTDAFSRIEVQDGATLDLSGRTTTLSVLSTQENIPLSFANGATVTVNLGSRVPAAYDCLVSWTKALRPNVTFQLDETSAQREGTSILVTDGGLYYVAPMGADDAVLTIASSHPALPGYDPVVGAIVKTDTECSAESVVIYENLPYNLLGYTIEKYEGGAWTGGATTNAGSAYAFSTVNKGLYRLTWCYEAPYNLTAKMREEAFEPVCEGPSYSAGTTPTNVYDNVTHHNSPGSSAGMNKRWICEFSKAPYAKMTVDSKFHEGFNLCPVAYRVWRLYDDNSGLARSPKSWTLKGLLSNGTEITLDTVTDCSWENGTTDDVRMKVFTLTDVPLSDFRAFVFTPTEAQSVKDYVGIFELEIFVRDVAVAANSLIVASTNPYEFDAVPAVGGTLTEAGTCTRTSKGYLGTSRYATAGYKLYHQNGSEWELVATEPTSESYTWDGTGGNFMLEWQWGDVDGYKVAPTTFGQETFTFSPAGDARGFFNTGAEVTVTPVGQTDPVSTFKEWVGSDVPAGSEKMASIVLTVDGPKTTALHCEFTRHWKFDTETSEFTDGNWRFVAATDTTTPVGTYTPDLQLANASYQAGRGLLDMTTLPSDTKRCITTIKNGAMNNGKTAITGLILPEGLAHIEEGVFNSCANLAFVEMSDSVLWCGNITANNGAFGSCAALKRVKLSNGIEFLGHQTFASCTALTNVVPFLPTSLKILGSAFQGCSKLEGTPNLSSVTSMVNGCFADCTKVVGDLDLEGIDIRSTSGTGAFQWSGITSAKNVEVLPSKIFYNCKVITNIACAAGITMVGNRAICGCNILERISAADDFASVEQLDEFAFSVSSTSLPGDAGLILPANWPSLKTLGRECFADSKFDNTLKFVLPSVTGMVAHPFWYSTMASIDLRGSTNLTTTVVEGLFDVSARGYIAEAILPASITTLGASTFSGWKSGRSYALRFCGDLPTTINATAFANTDDYNKFCVYVPEDNLASWTASEDFVALKDIEDVESKPGWADISKKRLIGTWRNKWCYTWVPNPKPCFMLFVR